MDWNKYIRDRYNIATHLKVGNDGYRWLVIIDTMTDFEEAETLVELLEPYRVTKDRKAEVVPEPGSAAEWAMTHDDDLPF